MTDDPLLNLSQARAKLGVSRRTLYYWMRAGMPYVQGESSRLIAASELRLADRLHRAGRSKRGRRRPHALDPVIAQMDDLLADRDSAADIDRVRTWRDELSRIRNDERPECYTGG